MKICNGHIFFLKKLHLRSFDPLVCTEIQIFDRY